MPLSHFRRISSHFRRIFSHFRRILSHFRRIFRIFVSSFVGHYRIYHMPLRAFSREPTVAFFAFSRSRPPPREKNEERKMKIPLFLVFRSPAHRTMCPGTHDSVCAPRSISRQLANVKDFLKNS
jgi:hypothetical protein